MTRKHNHVFVIFFCLIFMNGCATTPATTNTSIDNTEGRSSIYKDVTQPGPVQGIGIESQDIGGMTRAMVGDIIASGIFSGRNIAPRVVIDNEYFKNESNSIINTNRITLRLRAQLNRAAQQAGALIVFVGRKDSVAMVEAERELKRSGVVDGGGIRSTEATAGADYRLSGTITSGDIVDSSQTRVRETEIFFQLWDLEYNTVVWENFYDFKKAAQDDVIYR